MQPPELYFVFRELWTRYWSRLHALSTAPGSLLPLLRLFEDLLQARVLHACQTPQRDCMHGTRCYMHTSARL